MAETMEADNEKGETYTDLTCERCEKPIKDDSEVVLIESGVIEASKDPDLPYGGIAGNEVLEAYHWNCYGHDKRSDIRPSALSAKKTGNAPNDGVNSAE